MVRESRSIAFTNFDTDIEKTKTSLKNLACNYFIIGFEECPSTGRAHLQGYAQFNKKNTFIKITKVLSCHCEVPKGSVEDNIQYCKKSGQFLEEGVPRGLSNNTDKQAKWKELIELAKANNIEEIEIKHPSAAILHRKSL